MPRISTQLRVRLAAIHFWVSIIGGVLATWRLPPDGPDQMYQRVLIAISFYAITITSWDVLQTADVRDQQED